MRAARRAVEVRPGPEESGPRRPASLDHLEGVAEIGRTGAADRRDALGSEGPHEVVAQGFGVVDGEAIVGQRPDVHVSVDQPWEHGRPREVDGRRSVGHPDGSRRAGVEDAVTDSHDDGIDDRRPPRPVDEPTAPQRHGNRQIGHAAQAESRWRRATAC